jgi:hypothetical protein
MTPGRPLLPIRTGDTVKLSGLKTHLVVRDLLPDGRHAVCEQRAGPVSYLSYILALKDLVRCEPEAVAL